MRQIVRPASVVAGTVFSQSDIIWVHSAGQAHQWRVGRKQMKDLGSSHTSDRAWRAVSPLMP